MIKSESSRSVTTDSNTPKKKKKKKKSKYSTLFLFRENIGGEKRETMRKEKI